jgi:hypothetical protein
LSILYNFSVRGVPPVFSVGDIWPFLSEQNNKTSGSVHKKNGRIRFSFGVVFQRSQEYVHKNSVESDKTFLRFDKGLKNLKSSYLGLIPDKIYWMTLETSFQERLMIFAPA